MSEKPICPKCGTVAKLVDEFAIYGRRYKSGMIWACQRFPECDCYVGCHPNSTTPLGQMADKQTRTSRLKAHEHFDRLWKERHVKRSVAYAWITKDFGYQVHIGESDATTCAKISEWAKARLKEFLTPRPSLLGR